MATRELEDNELRRFRFKQRKFSFQIHLMNWTKKRRVFPFAFQSNRLEPNLEFLKPELGNIIKRFEEESKN